MEVEFDNELYDFPDDATDDEIISFFDQPKLTPENRLEPGVYQDEEGKLFKITPDGEIVEHA